MNQTPFSWPRPWFFVSDLHGVIPRYDTLLDEVSRRQPAALLMGGDLLPNMGLQFSSRDIRHQDFIHEYLVPEFTRLKTEMGTTYPRVLLILGNDDPRIEEAAFLQAGSQGLWETIHNRRVDVDGVAVYGYSHVPPTPFHLKDWERYDVSRFVDPGCVSPEDGHRTIAVDAHRIRWATIKDDLEKLTGEEDVGEAVFLFHSPPYKSRLDRAALDGKMVDHAPLDVHVGSIAIQRFIRNRQPLLTLHGHVHESAALTGSWQDTIGGTTCLTAAHHGPELALVEFHPGPELGARRQLLGSQNDSDSGVKE